MSSACVNSKLRGPGRPKTKDKELKKQVAGAEAPCAWCDSTAIPLKYVWETEKQKKKFCCSQECIVQFREFHRKGICTQCENIVAPGSPSKEFCSTSCMAKNQRLNSVAGGVRPVGQNNNNDSVNNNNSPRDARHSPVTAVSARSFQYESFNVFNWDDYLKVRISCCYNYNIKILELKMLKKNVYFYHRKQKAYQLRVIASNKHSIHRLMNSKLE